MKKICLLHCQVDREEPHTNARDLYSLTLFSKFGDLEIVNVFGPGVEELESIHFDLVIVSNSFMVMRSSPYWKFLIKRVKKLLTNASQRILFLQDDYHRIDRTVSFAKNFDIQICTVFSGDNGIYSGLGVRTYPWLIGFADEENDRVLSSMRIDWSRRTIDVGQRVYFLPLEFGTEGRRKAELAVSFREKMTQLGLVCDISTDDADRFSGMDWFKFLSNCRSTIGRQSGASLTTSSPFNQVKAAVIQDVYGKEKFEKQLKRYMGRRQLEKPFLAPSPRLFEAASLHVLQVLEKSSVSYGIKEWEHYIPVEPDLADFEIVAKFLKSSEAIEMTRRCHDELFNNPKWKRENWIGDLGISLGLQLLTQRGNIKVPESEIQLYEVIKHFDSRQERCRRIRSYSNSLESYDWSPIEVVFRWVPVALAEVARVIGQDIFAEPISEEKGSVSG
jgi:hypothetical protein